jgi:hypothetical protein
MRTISERPPTAAGYQTSNSKSRYSRIGSKSARLEVIGRAVGAGGESNQQIEVQIAQLPDRH